MSYYYEHEEDAKERRIDCDLCAAYEYGMRSDYGFRLEDVAYVLASVMGENDGPEYYWLIAMRDHTYAVVEGGCDYTGWDCQADATAEIFPTMLLAINSLPEKEQYDNRLIRKSIELQLVGKLGLGEAKE